MTDFNTGDYQHDRAAACAWAHDLTQRDDWVVFDTETSGLGAAEILQIGLLAPDGTALMDSLVRPDWSGFVRSGVPAEATAIHGITDGMLGTAPTLIDLLPEMGRLMHGREVVVYNADYDQGVLAGCLHRRWSGGDRAAELGGAVDAWVDACRWACAMLPYSAYVGDWHDYFGNYRYQRLPGGDHTAIGDCRATLDVIKRMAAGHEGRDA